MATDYIDREITGKSSPIQASFLEFHGPLGKAWPETFKNLDLAMTTDPLSGTSTGGFSYLSSIDPKTWKRSHAGSAYYAPVADRPNLHLLTDSLVEKIILKRSGSDVVATSVQFTRNVAEMRSEMREKKCSSADSSTDVTMVGRFLGELIVGSGGDAGAYIEFCYGRVDGSFG